MPSARLGIQGTPATHLHRGAHHVACAGMCRPQPCWHVSATPMLVCAALACAGICSPHSCWYVQPMLVCAGLPRTGMCNSPMQGNMYFAVNILWIPEQKSFVSVRFHPPSCHAMDHTTPSWDWDLFFGIVSFTRSVRPPMCTPFRACHTKGSPETALHHSWMHPGTVLYRLPDHDPTVTHRRAPGATTARSQGLLP